MEKINKKNTKIIGIIIIILFILLIFSVIFAIINIPNNKIIKGVSLQGVDISNCTKEEANEKINKLIEGKINKKIIIKYDENEINIIPNDINVKYDINNKIEEAYLIGRKNNIFINNIEIIKTFLFKKDFNLSVELDDNKLNELINDISEKIPGKVEQYSYFIEDEQLIITKGKDGILVDKEKLEKEIKDEILNIKNDNISTITIPVEYVKADNIDIEKIHSEIYKEAQDAYITENPTTVHPHVNGIDFDISLDEAQEIISEDKEEYIIPLKIVIPNKTLSDLGEEAFPDTISTFSTKYDVGNSNRATNIRLATEKINNTIIMPGEVFSYNQIVGKRTMDAGYKEAGAYAGGQVVQTVGGGICQVSSTLYNAVLYANLDIVERYNHYFESSYVDASRDATVSWGSLDFKFKNTRKYPIKIVATAKNGVNLISICGIKEDDEPEIIIQSKVISKIERKIVYEEDDELEKGEEIIKQNGHDGCISEAYKIVRKDGIIISNTLLSRDKYSALDRIIRKGTKEETKIETKKENENNEIENKQTENTAIENKTNEILDNNAKR